ncbi:hypothetical protein CPB83DRAFT_663689 [Crepidotus variabilis]|uniref:Uncharacterized protein n=1 Tax=Crepidotus variabilis TaxID=179855 RepID=A0A9P6ELW6_9AGAR|nr:hypothetical protein CPB83DRAFT_663689 [Crepidotus variabilis]
MFSNRNSLDSPPPHSQFRRPWSPDAYEDAIPGNTSYGRWQNSQMEHTLSDQGHQSGSQPGTSSGHRQQQYQQQRRREASEVSVEALDLADYAKTLRARQTEDPYPPFPSQFHQPEREPQAHYPPSSFPNTYLPQLAHSRDSLAMHPPSLVSRGPTLSSATTNHTGSSSAPSFAQRAARRPYSLPATPKNSSQGSHSSRGQGGPRQSPLHRPGQLHPSGVGGPYIVDPTLNPSSDEIDISNFPKWSRGWYTNNSNPHLHSSTKKFGDMDDMYNALPQANLNGNSTSKKHMSPFDPGYVHNSHGTYTNSTLDPYDVPPPLSAGHDSTRDLLPWGSEPPEYGAPIDPLTKEERYRMLEREYGGTGKSGKGKDKDSGWGLVDEDGKPLVGTIDEKGSLVTSGPKRRIAVRVMQFFFTVGACIPAIYAAVAIKPTDPKDPPPPANKPPVFVLYIVSSLTLLGILYLFVVRPCCIRRSKPSSKSPLTNMGMMVLPVNGPGGKKGGKYKPPKGGKKGKKGKYGPGGGPGDVQVNLIVDPKAFQPPDADDETDDEEDGVEDDEMIPGGFGGYDDRERARRKKKRRRRRGIMEGMRMEEEWKVARSWLKKMTAVDAAGLILWSGIFVFILTGKKCPSGQYNGWCNAYNVSTACACLLAVAFGFSIFFDVQDLHSSKQSPRTRS